jgi:hypothetical protein
MSVFLETKHGRANKPDLRLAESYIPALLLCVKGMFYSSIAPIILLMQWKVTVLAVALFALFLYTDHLYLVLPNTPVLIDTTALSLDIYCGTLLVLVMTMLRPCSQQCQLVLGLWTFCSACCILFFPHVPKPAVHVLSLSFVLCFIYADLDHQLPLIGAPSNGTAGINSSSVAQPSSLPYFSRSALYLSLVILDIYLFRPPLQQENERLLFCKFGPVLLGAWPWCILFWLALASVHLAKLPLLQQAPQPAATGGQELDLMEAFRLAKQQHMGGKSESGGLIKGQ